jgi:hypothetical protein
LKKPSAYLPFLETSLSLTASDWPDKMVSVMAELAWMNRKRGSVIYMRRCMIMKRVWWNCRCRDRSYKRYAQWSICSRKRHGRVKSQSRVHSAQQPNYWVESYFNRSRATM